MTMQSRLNDVAILNIYSQEAGNLNMDESMDGFRCKNPKQTWVFALSSNK